MRQVSKILLAGTLLVVQPLLAQTTGTGQTILLPLSDELNGGEMARVVTDNGRPQECLAPLAVTRVDGETRVVSAKGFFIEPGVHTLNGSATLDLSYCALDEANFFIRNVADLEVDFAAGGTYYIGYYHPPDKLDEWKLVVWNIESVPAEP